MPDLSLYLDALAEVAARTEPGPEREAALQHVLDQAEAEVPLEEALAVPVVQQGTKYTCGPAALRSALAVHGIDMSEDDLADLLGTNSTEGTRPGALEEMARDLGCEVEGRDHLTLQDVQGWLAAERPVLCCIQAHGGGHWVTVEAVTRDGVYFADPARGGAGKRCWSREKWMSRWYDLSADGTPYVRYGLAIGPPTGAADSVTP